MDLDNIYSLRQSFSIIGLTGRKGAGVNKTAEILTKSFKENDFERTRKRFFDYCETTELKRKFEIIYNFAKHNWQQYKIINYKNVVLLHLLRMSEEELKELLFGNFEDEQIKSDILKLFKDNNKLQADCCKISSLNKDLSEIEELKNLGRLFFSKSFNDFCEKFNQIIECRFGLHAIIDFYNKLSYNLRKFGSPDERLEEGASDKNIYTIAETINRIIKGYKANKKELGKDNVHIVINSLRNSIELMFFKERYSAFYMMSVNSDDRRNNIRINLRSKQLPYEKEDVNKILKRDSNEYFGNHAKEMEFYGPDVQNCIQKSDIHLKFTKSLNKDDFISLQSLLLKYTSLIQQPGIVKPSKLERCMQVAYTAKFNSGCISRQVGAVVADSEFSVKSIGWNDVAKGQISCLYRNVNDLIGKTTSDQLNEWDEQNTYSKFETSTEKSSNHKFNFRKQLEKKYEGVGNVDMNGRNCSFCFKSNYNDMTGENNQVHTRSLHAEENAMLQVSKKGGVGLKNGILFTTASPCELCSKKAYQLGISEVYYIDPYPGIAKDHILKGGNENSNPELKLFFGAVGQAYHKLYEPFMAYKDEIKIRTGYPIKPDEKRSFGITRESAKVISSNPELQKEVEELVANYKNKNK